MTLALDLDLAQEYYFVGDLEKAHATRQCNRGQHGDKHAIKSARRMQSWINVVSARSHDTAVEPIVYKHGRKGGYVTWSCAHFCSAGARSRGVKKLP